MTGDGVEADALAAAGSATAPVWRVAARSGSDARRACAALTRFRGFVLMAYHVVSIASRTATTSNAMMIRRICPSLTDVLS